MNKKVIIKIVIIILLLGIIIALTIVNLNNKNTKISRQQTSKEQLTETDKSITMNLLWENPSSNSKMTADTTISLSSNDYNWLIVESRFLNTHTDEYPKVTSVTIKGENIRLNGVGYTTNAASAHRGLLYVNDTTYNTTAATLSLNAATPSTNNAYLIPYRIYGIK